MPGHASRLSTGLRRPDLQASQRRRTLLQAVPGLATRYAKRAAYYRAEVIIAAIVLWLR
jgi:hypothetical protein